MNDVVRASNIGVASLREARGINLACNNLNAKPVTYTVLVMTNIGRVMRVCDAYRCNRRHQHKARQ
jgi:hypothetical protein